MLPLNNTESRFHTAAASAGVTKPISLPDVIATATRIREEAKHLAHFLKKACRVKPIAAHNAIARAASFDGWTAMAAHCDRISDTIFAQAEAEAALVASLAGAVPLLVDIDTRVPVAVGQINALTDFAASIAGHLGSEVGHVREALAKSKGLPSWAGLFDRAAESNRLLYAVVEGAEGLRLAPLAAEEQLMAHLGVNEDDLVQWPFRPTLDDAKEIERRLRAALDDRPDFIRGYAMLAAILDNQRNPTCLMWYDKASLEVERLIDQTAGRGRCQLDDFGADLVLHLGRNESWAIARYLAEYPSAMALSAALSMTSPGASAVLLGDQIAFACAQGQWDFEIDVAEVDSNAASLGLWGLFRLVRSVALGFKQLEPNGLADLMQAWISIDVTEALLTRPTAELEGIDLLENFSAGVKLVRETRSAEFKVVMDMLVQKQGFFDGMRAILHARDIAEGRLPGRSTDGETALDWYFRFQSFVDTMTGRVEHAGQA